MRTSWLLLVALSYSAVSAATEHRWFVVNTTDAACEALDGPRVASPPMRDLKTPEQVLALKKREWPDAKLSPLLDYVAKHHIPRDAIPVDFHLINRANAFVVSSASRAAELLLLRDDACFKIDSDAP